MDFELLLPQNLPGEWPTNLQEKTPVRTWANFSIANWNLNLFHIQLYTPYFSEDNYTKWQHFASDCIGLQKQNTTHFDTNFRQCYVYKKEL